jgi:hypothetical protein
MIPVAFGIEPIQDYLLVPCLPEGLIVLAPDVG